MRTPLADRVITRIQPTDFGCWEWAGYHTAGGRPMVTDLDGWTGLLVYRVLYEHFVGPIAPDLELDHLCRHPWCCNPMHLEAVSHRENLSRSNAPTGINARKTHCVRGHELTEANVYRRRDRLGRACRECTRLRARARKAAA